MPYSKVKAYRRKDGTPVRAHNRVNNSNPDPQTPSMISVDHLLGLDLPPASSFTQPNLNDIRSEFDRLFNKEGLNFSNIVDEKSSAALVAGSVTGIVASLGFGAIPLGLAAAAVGVTPTIVRFARSVYTTSDPIERFKRHIKKKKLFQSTKKDEAIMRKLAENGWYTEAYQSETKGTEDYLKSKSSVSETGFGSVQGELHTTLAEQAAAIPVRLNFFPGVVLPEEKLYFHMDLPGVNLEGADLSKAKIFSANFSGANLRGVTWEGGQVGELNLEGADLEGANLRHLNTKRIDSLSSDVGVISFRGANLNNTDLSNSQLDRCDFSGCDLTTTNLEGARMPDDLNNVTITDDQFESFNEGFLTKSLFQYEKCTFDSAMKDLGLNEQRMEFLILSGAIKVRDNVSNERVTSKFDPEKHHVPRWEVDAARKTLNEEPEL